MSVRISAQEQEDAIKLLKLMGMPVIEAPAEAEPQCTWLAKNNYVDAIVSEDMDTLVFGG